MSIDYATGSRLKLNDDRAWFPLRSGSSSLAYCPRFDLTDLSGVNPGAVKIPGTGSPNRPPDAIVAFMNAASFRIAVQISGNGQSASFDEVIELGMNEERGEDGREPEGEPITSLAARWQWAQFEDPPQSLRVPFATTSLSVFNEVGGGQELLDFTAFFEQEARLTQIFYSIEEDLWSIFFSFFVGVNDGLISGSEASAEYSLFASEDDTFSTGFTLMGFECPLRLSEGASVSGSITAESYLTRY